MTPKDQKIWQEYLESKKRIMAGTTAPSAEPVEGQRKRIEKLKGNFEDFCQYYFPHYMAAPFAYFHKRDVKAIVRNPKIMAVLEWPRAHAKSVVADVFLTLYVKALGELDGVILVSNNKDKAMMLLLDCQAELEANERYIHDYGKQATFGDWAEQSFATQDGTGFWAYGRGQSPRGTRKAAKRPNLIIVDDIDDKEICRNQDRVLEAVDWLKEDLMGCFSLKGGRFIMVGNRIHKQSILAHMVGDVEEDQPVHAHLYHSKVYALENPKTHKEDQSETGVPAWKEYYSRADVDARVVQMGYRASQREFFHKHIQEGRTFKNDWITWHALPPLSQYQHVVTYCDPSYKDTRKNDFKAIVMLGRIGKYYDVIDAWVAQSTKKAMVTAHYDFNEFLLSGGNVLAYHCMEANFIQEMHIEEYVKESESRGYMLAIHADKRQKPQKQARIENLTPLFERGLVRFNAARRKSIHMQALVDQFLGFPAAHDDGPDAFEGAVWISNSKQVSQIPTFHGDRRRTQRL
jgi:predicted phage terminase large subunit-like protein